MSCTTILVGKKASYDGSTMVARNDDSCSGDYSPKKHVVISPQEQSSVYISVLSHVRVELPDNPQAITAVPNALKGKGIWAASGVNEAHVGMSATETITSNPRVLGADPLVVYQPATDDSPEIPGGLGEEDLVYIVLPYIHSAREGVIRLGALLEQYGTYELNAIAFQDHNEIWWLETIGGHHWLAKRVPDASYVVMPNQLGLDSFDFNDAFTTKKDHLCSQDLVDFITDNHLGNANAPDFNPRLAFGSHEDADHIYNTPRAWFILRYINPTTYKWDGPQADYLPTSDNLPWFLVPEHKITPEDVKYALSSYFQGTPFNPYGDKGESSLKGIFRPVGINRTSFMELIHMRPHKAADNSILEWLSFASNAFNVMVPFYASVSKTPEYLSNTTEQVSTDNFYWTSRLIAALADASYHQSILHIERYQLAVASKSHELINKYDKLLAQTTIASEQLALREKANAELAHMAKEEADKTLLKVLDTTSSLMKNSFSRSDA